MHEWAKKVFEKNKYALSIQYTFGCFLRVAFCINQKLLRRRIFNQLVKYVSEKNKSKKKGNEENMKIGITKNYLVGPYYAGPKGRYFL